MYQKNTELIPYEMDFFCLNNKIMRLKTPEEYSSGWKRLQLDQLPLLPDEIGYTVKNKGMYNEIGSLIQTGAYDAIINACETNREGQLTFWQLIGHMMAEITCQSRIPIYRFWNYDMTDRGIFQALTNLELESNNRLTALTQAAQLRAEADWLIGINVSRAVSFKMKNINSLGLVKTPILAYLADREKAISFYRPQELYNIEVKYSNGLVTTMYDADKKSFYYFGSQKDAFNAMQNIGDKHIACQCISKDRITPSPGCHTLSSLQSDANKSYGYAPQKVLNIAQLLYHKKLISYPRTENTYLTSDIVSRAPDILSKLRGFPTLLPHIKKIDKDIKLYLNRLRGTEYVNDAKAKFSHGIVPTGEAIMFNMLTQQELNIIHLIAKRFISVFLPPLIQGLTQSIIENTNPNVKYPEHSYLFYAFGKETVESGFSTLYGNMQEIHCPKVAEKELLHVEKIALKLYKTRPPKRLNDAMLLDVLQNMENNVTEQVYKDMLHKVGGLGTASTRGDLIEDIVSSKFVVRKNSLLYVEKTGIELINKIGHLKIASPVLTAQIEQQIMDVETMKEPNIDIARSNIYKIVEEMTNEIKRIETKKDIKLKDNVFGKCPRCGSDFMESKTGYYCKQNGCFYINKWIKGTFITPDDMNAMLQRQKIHCNIDTRRGPADCDLSLNLATAELDFYFCA